MHPKLLAKYKREAPELLEDRMETASEGNERSFWEQVNRSKVKVKREVTHLYRTKVGKKEYFWYGEELRSNDNLGNPIDHYHVIGKWENPQFVYQLGPEGRKIASSIGGYTTEYELEWPKDFTEEIESKLIEKTQLYAKIDTGIGGKKTYGILNYEDFKDASFEDLLTLGKYGTLDPKGIEREKNRQEHKKLQKQLTTR
jgi:hypothetical protein